MVAKIPESPTRFMFWRRSAVFSCKRRLHWLKLHGHHVESVGDLLCCHCSAAFESRAQVQRGPVGDVEGQSALVWMGAFFDLYLAHGVVSRVTRLHIQCERFGGQRFREYREHPRSAAMVVESVQNVWWVTVFTAGQISILS